MKIDLINLALIAVAILILWAREQLDELDAMLDALGGELL